MRPRIDGVRQSVAYSTIALSVSFAVINFVPRVSRLAFRVFRFPFPVQRNVISRI